MTLDEYRDEVQIAIQKVALLVKEVYQIGEALVHKSEDCEADPEDIAVLLMSYVAAVQKMQEPDSVH